MGRALSRLKFNVERWKNVRRLNGKAAIVTSGFRHRQSDHPALRCRGASVLAFDVTGREKDAAYEPAGTIVPFNGDVRDDAVVKAAVDQAALGSGP
jgi:hypothetical protein